MKSSFIKKVFVLAYKSAELILEPLGSSTYEKYKSIDNLYRTYCLGESERITRYSQ